MAHSVRDPALFFSVYVHKHLPGFVEEDPRLLVLQQVDRFAETHGLAPDGQDWLYDKATGIDLVALDRSQPSLQRLVNLIRRLEPFRCVVYAHQDALIVQIVIGKEGQCESLLRGWEELADLLYAGFDGDALEAASRGTFGASAVYWAMADAVEPFAYADEAAAIAARKVPLCTETDIGPLWRSQAPIFPRTDSVAQDRWVLVTPPTRQAESEANKRYNQLRDDRPPNFALVALARHKVAFERAEYEPEHENLHRMRRTLDRRSRWLIDTQRYHGNVLGELGAPESVEFQQKLTRAYTNFADYNQTARMVQELARTVGINRMNFLVNCTALVSAEGADRVRSSPSQKDEAARFLADWRERHEEEIFQGELGQMQQLAEQLEADVEYTQLVLERQATSLHAGEEQLRIAGQRELGEISEYHALEAAAVVASVAAIVTLELLRLGNTLEEQADLSANLMLFAVTGSFALVQLLSRRGRAKSWLQQVSVAAAAGFGAGTLLALAWGEGSVSLLVNVAVVVLGAILGWLVLRSSDRRARRRRRRRRHEIDVLAEIGKLIYAREELPELLEDLPPTTTYRLKDERSLLEKLERKSAERARERGITVEELRRRGEAYEITDIGDAIGVRYVVRPSRIPEVVDRIRAVTRARSVEYADRTTTIGRKLEQVDGRREEVDDPDYQGKYRGFRMNYKSIHLDVDLWGVGAQKDVNLLAEVQVRTPLQNLPAAWFHDIMYKERPESNPARGAGRELRIVRCARQTSAEKRGGGSIAVTTTDDSIVVGDSPVRAGAVNVVATNDGTVAHDLVIEGPGLEATRTAVLEPGATETITVTLEPREYTFYCSLDGHRSQGMEAKVDVEATLATPWLVRFFDLWHPRLNRPLARVVILLSNLELRLFRKEMEWRGQ